MLVKYVSSEYIKVDFELLIYYTYLYGYILYIVSNILESSKTSPT